MMKQFDSRVLVMVFLSAVLCVSSGAFAADYLSPCATVASNDGKTLYVAEEDAKAIAVFDIKSGKVTKKASVPAPPTGLAVAPEGNLLAVTCAAPEGTACIIDTSSGRVARKIPVGHGATGPSVSPDGRLLYVCNRFENDVSVVDISTGKTVSRIPTGREPVASAITPDGKRLFVANHLPLASAAENYVASNVTVIDTAARKAIATIKLPSGSVSLRGICVSPDGRFAFVTHILGRFHMPTTQLERGWMNTNAMTIIDASDVKYINTVLLDDVDKGAANPWGVTTTADSKTVCVAHAGTHELSVVDVEGLMKKLAKLPEKLDKAKTATYTAASVVKSDVPNDLSFLVGLRRRIKLKGNGPRALAVVGDKAYVPEYFSDTLSIVDLSVTARDAVEAVALGPKPKISQLRRGEIAFNDAETCFQNWQSCTSCHPDARADALNWDLLNDGIGNPKNTKSMFLAHKTPPAMVTGVRPRAEVAVRAGMHHIQFAVRPEEEAKAIDAYLKSLKPVPSPHLVDGKLSKAAQRGKKLFFSDEVGCGKCHPEPLYTSQKIYNVGTRGELARRDDFDTPALVESWRTGPYLHDGRAVTMKDVLTKTNPKDKHGKTSDLTNQQISDLAEFVLSL